MVLTESQDDTKSEFDFGAKVTQEMPSPGGAAKRISFSSMDNFSEQTQKNLNKKYEHYNIILYREFYFINYI